MEVLFVYDGSFSALRLKEALPSHITHLRLFPLTSQPTALDVSVVQITTVNSADLIEKAVDSLRQTIFEWSHQLGELKVKAKSVKDWLVLPSLKMSTWWLSQLSETNTIQTEAFLHIAQVAAVKTFLQHHQMQSVIFCIKDKKLRHSLMNVAKTFNLKIINLKNDAENIKTFSLQRVISIVRRIKNSSYLLAGILTLVTVYYKKLQALQILPDKKQRLLSANKLALVSYFPLIDMQAAERGELYDNFSAPLQKELRKQNIPISWILLPVSVNNISYKDSLKIAERLIQKKENLFILYEFLNLKNVFQAFFFWLKQVSISYFLTYQIKNKKNSLPLMQSESDPIVWDLWHSSFVGTTGMLGILYAILFRNIFSELKMNDCVYYCEMQAWEKALNAMKNRVNPLIKTTAFQHSSIPRNLFHYFYSPKDLLITGKNSDFPQPDRLAGNGELMRNYLNESHYAHVCQLESVRYLYLDAITAKDKQFKAKPKILIVSSIKAEETIALLSLINQVFPVADTVDIQIKTHPSLSLEELTEKLSWSLEKSAYQICDDNIKQYLPQADIVISLSATVILEALAFGCEIVIPVFADVMTMNPLQDFEEYYYRVTTPDELQMAIHNILSSNNSKASVHKNDLIRKYWDLDKSLSKWKKHLNINCLEN